MPQMSVFRIFEALPYGLRSDKMNIKSEAGEEKKECVPFTNVIKSR